MSVGSGISYSCIRFANRLTGIKENAKFQKNGRTKNDPHVKEDEDDKDPASGLKLLVKEAKNRHKVK